MDKLQTIVQETKTNLLPTEPLGPDPDEIPPGKCEWVLTSGRSEGLPCGKSSFDGNLYCVKHSLLMANKVGRETKEPSGIQEINVMSKCSDRVPIVDLKVNPKPVEDLAAKLDAFTSTTSTASTVPAQPFVHPQLREMIRQQARASKPDEIAVSDLISILKDFSRTMANLTDIYKKSQGL
ncbi:MAG TPA: hypothetical protein VGF75_03370 [Candidatus Saccharimonadales bacterium]